jgi:hypothetical protein
MGDVTDHQKPASSGQVRTGVPGQITFKTGKRLLGRRKDARMNTDTTGTEAASEEKHGLMDKIAGAVEHMVNKNDDAAPTIEPIEDAEPVVPASETPAGEGPVISPALHVDDTGKIAGSV